MSTNTCAIFRLLLSYFTKQRGYGVYTGFLAPLYHVRVCGRAIGP
jgi:hypothetical protein